MWGSFWHHFGVILGSLGIILGPLGTIVGHLGTNLLHVGPMYRIYAISGQFREPLGHPFLTFGIPWYHFSGMQGICDCLGNLVPGQI